MNLFNNEKDISRCTIKQISKSIYLLVSYNSEIAFDFFFFLLDFFFLGKLLLGESGLSKRLIDSVAVVIVSLIKLVPLPRSFIIGKLELIGIRKKETTAFTTLT